MVNGLLKNRDKERLLLGWVGSARLLSGPS